MKHRKPKNWAEHLIDWYRYLEPPQHLPQGIDWLHPQKDPQVFSIVEQFFHKFYEDSHTRHLLLGINPGRFGAGITGVNFTAAKQLTDDCGIEHGWGRGTELSAEFIYDMIRAYGGPQKFYSRFFIGSASPLGFVRDGKNLNYYDDKELMRTVEPFIVHNIDRLLSYHVDRSKAYAIGGEKNFKALLALNEKHRWFGELIPLPHPRFIMQYRRKQKEQFIEQYLRALGTGS